MKWRGNHVRCAIFSRGQCFVFRALGYELTGDPIVPLTGFDSVRDVFLTCEIELCVHPPPATGHGLLLCLTPWTRLAIAFSAYRYMFQSGRHLLAYEHSLRFQPAMEVGAFRPGWRPENKDLFDPLFYSIAADHFDERGDDEYAAALRDVAVMMKGYDSETLIVRASPA